MDCYVRCVCEIFSSQRRSFAGRIVLQAQTVVARSLGASGRWVPFAGLVAEHRNGYRKYDFLNEAPIQWHMAWQEWNTGVTGSALVPALTIQFGSNTVQKKPPIMEHILCM